MTTIKEVQEACDADDCREQFEKFISSPPYELSTRRFTAEYAWPGNYVEYAAELAWCVWEELWSRRALVFEPEVSAEPVAPFYIYRPTKPFGKIDVKHDALPWVYDQDPQSGFCARMLVVPYSTQPKAEPVATLQVGMNGIIECVYKGHLCPVNQNAALLEDRIPRLTTIQLYTSPQPCQYCLELEAAILSQQQMRIDAEAQIAAIEAENKELRENNPEDAKYGFPRWQTMQATIAQQAERIKELEEILRGIPL
jgi:hypothetical protein